jgi:uncharacterized membrane-anchored protein
MRNALLFGGLALVLGVTNVAIVQKEAQLAAGTQMLVELAPVDPRSLIQGDYMRLDYRIARDVRANAEWPRDGTLVVRLDDRGVAQFVRRHDPGAPLGAGEHLLQYRRRGQRLRLGSDAYFFQEGRAADFAGARYGELRVARSGASVLVGLRDSARAAIR